LAEVDGRRSSLLLRRAAAAVVDGVDDSGSTSTSWGFGEHHWVLLITTEGSVEAEEEWRELSMERGLRWNSGGVRGQRPLCLGSSLLAINLRKEGKGGELSEARHGYL
jgi:hypothetical protein